MLVRYLFVQNVIQSQTGNFRPTVSTDGAKIKLGYELVILFLGRYAVTVRGEEQEPTHVPLLQSWKTNEEVFCHWHDLKSGPCVWGLGEAARVLVCCATGKVRSWQGSFISRYILTDILNVCNSLVLM